MSDKPAVGAIHFGPAHTLEATPATDVALYRKSLDQANSHIRLLAKELEHARHLLRIAVQQGVHWSYGQDKQQKDWDKAVSEMLERAMP